MAACPIWHGVRYRQSSGHFLKSKFLLQDIFWQMELAAQARHARTWAHKHEQHADTEILMSAKMCKQKGQMRHRLSGGGQFWCEHVNDRRMDKNNQSTHPSVFVPSSLWIQNGQDYLGWFGYIIIWNWCPWSYLSLTLPSSWSSDLFIHFVHTFSQFSPLAPFYSLRYGC